MLTNLTVRALLIALNPYFYLKNCIAWLIHIIPFLANCQCQKRSLGFVAEIACAEMQLLSHFILTADVISAICL